MDDPSVLVVAGAFVAEGSLALFPLLLVTIVASLLGDTLWYLAGRYRGHSVLRTLCRVAIEPALIRAVGGMGNQPHERTSVRRLRRV